ncbi:hypothetical protein GYMLUDRAFT_69595 [Collybiopsis luxurians FD-317 M1]|nr:hypothetical protein GYMLUDRAFT_69595 [Collybiopsis luxurians FD-317 M1]
MPPFFLSNPSFPPVKVSGLLESVNDPRFSVLSTFLQSTHKLPSAHSFQPFHTPLRRDLGSPSDNPVATTLILIFVVIIVPSICLYIFRCYARRKVFRERETCGTTLRQRQELHRNVEQLERDFSIPGSSYEPLPAYYPRPPSYTSDDLSHPDLCKTLHSDIKITPPAPVIFNSRPRLVICTSPGLYTTGTTPH